MRLLRDQTARLCGVVRDLMAVLVSGVLMVGLAQLAHGGPPTLEFIQPTNNALFSTRDEVPIVLRAVASNDVFLTGEVFANNLKIADVSYCCALCPCFRPQPGDETTLQIPVPWDNGSPPARPWQGWTNVPARTYQLTARATGENGTVVQAAPVTITVFDRTLWIFPRSDGTVMLTIPQGSMTRGRYDLEASEEMKTWTRVGSFEPGNVAAFYFGLPTSGKQTFYRSVYIPHE